MLFYIRGKNPRRRVTVHSTPSPSGGEAEIFFAETEMGAGGWHRDRDWHPGTAAEAQIWCDAPDGSARPKSDDAEAASHTA